MQFINPYKLGLLGGIANWATAMEKYNVLHETEAARERAYQIKYGAMSDVKNLQSQNNLLLKRLQLEAGQRSYTALENGADGKPYTVAYRNVYNPDTQQFEPHETGRVPYESKGDIAAATQAAIADRMSSAQEAAAARAAAHEKAVDERTGTREDARDARAAAAEKARQDAADKKDQQTKLGQAEAQTNADMKAFRAMSPMEQAKELAASGIDTTVANPKGSKGFFSDTSQMPNPDAINQYRKAMLDQHKKELGVGAASEAAGAAPAAPAGAQPSFTPDGRQIKYGKDGTPYIKGPDGKPVPYVADANGMPDSPLAMDQAMPDDLTGAGSELADEEESPQGPPLLAGADEQPDESSDVFNPQAMESEDQSADDQDQGILSGQYA